MFNRNHVFLTLLITLSNHNVNSSICEGVCSCRFNMQSDDESGEKIDCSHTPEVLNTSEVLPKSVYSLDLSSNNMTSVNPSSLYRSKSMVQLYLNNNNIKELNDVLELPQLKLLDLSDNILEFIHANTFRNVKKLEYLNLANNKFHSFDKLAFHHSTNLKEIVLDYNNIGPSLREVNLFDREGFGLTHHIKNISMRGVNLNTVPDNFFIDVFDLRKLDISSNNLTEIFELPFTLEYLDLSDNPITVITFEDFSDLRALKVLKLNNLRIKEVPEYVFSPLHALEHLELERNRNLTEFSPLAFGLETLEEPEDFILQTLSLKGSRLTTIDVKLKELFGELIRLDLQGNYWKCDCNLVWVKQLRINERDYQELRCAYPVSLYNKRIFEIEDKYFICPVDRHIFGMAIAIISIVVVLTTIALWLFLFLPKYQSRSSFIQNWHTPSTAYTVLPIGSELVESRF